MLAYRHGFHAGNHADVLKHLVLIELLDALRRKDKPFCVIDTHAGDGVYALDAPESAKLAEHAGGIGRLWEARGLHPAVDVYLDAVAVHNPAGALRRYPGSPLLVAERLRPGDRLVAAEAHGTAYEHLSECLGRRRGVQLRAGDGYASLKALLPPSERRGLVLIDPSYETAGEYERLNAALRMIHQRFRQGMVAVWYPLVPRKPAAPWLASVRELGIPDVLVAELRVEPPGADFGLYGSGMLLINPPWGLEATLREALPRVAECMAGSQGEVSIRVLVDERGGLPAATDP
ncbi:23S rRNA (adenine(2030)-N(6))-methyltransferase RlmJ [Acidihalobacter prosperus]|uniref:Ribosomal RNA large subunit methyltransferase J n=1 Tax=Acidihalobacter prosperus TaxID=160660 RepID=A0A1A6C2V9_9GAMM|nr:23S rRNA (adenine(2030)-N(6))-methyltransferase RlmJ [Acidihalobacter prosperus]OBS08893.1 hypothetical protein Thpro_023143 [Acidihalobacter prosperus]